MDCVGLETGERSVAVGRDCMQHMLHRNFMIRGDGSGEKGMLRPSSDTYVGIADLCIL